MMAYCAFGENCSVYDPTVGLPGLATGPLCAGCRQRCASELSLLRYDYLDLSQLIPKNPQPSDIKIAHAKPESSPPIDMGVYTLREDIARALLVATWAVRLRREDSMAPGAVREGFGMQRSVEYLSCYLDDLAELPVVRAIWRASDDLPAELDGVGVLTYLSLLHRSARKACGLDKGHVRLPGDCGRCLASALRRSLDEPGKIWCGNCNLQLTGEDYLSLIRVTDLQVQR